MATREHDQATWHAQQRSKGGKRAAILVPVGGYKTRGALSGLSKPQTHQAHGAPPHLHIEFCQPAFASQCHSEAASTVASEVTTRNAERSNLTFRRTRGVNVAVMEAHMEAMMEAIMEANGVQWRLVVANTV